MEPDNIANYQVLHLLGKGGFASVYKAKCVHSNREVAIKMVDKVQMNASGMSGRVRQEVAIHSRLKHPAILELLSFFEDQKYVYLVLELAENGELAQFLKQNNRVFSEQDSRTVLGQVVGGLLYLHSHGIMHRDLSLANLLLAKNMEVKIGDFGLATQMASPSERHVTMCGTPNFISPEVATRSSHGLEADVWGLGCLLYTMLVGKPPFDTAGVRSTLTRVVMADYSLPEEISPEAKDLISNLLRKNPKERISLRDIPSHPWMRLTPQDSGMYTMSNTAFSSNSIKPGTRPLAAYPALTEYSEENEKQSVFSNITAQPSSHRGGPVLGQQMVGSDPHLLHPSSPPVKMVSDPQDLPAPLLQPPLSSLRSKLSSLPSFPCLQDLQPNNRSHHSILSQHQQPPSLSRQFSNPESYRPPTNLRPQEVDTHSIRSRHSDSSQPRYTANQFINPTQYLNHPGSSAPRPPPDPVQESPSTAEAGEAGIQSLVAPLSSARLRPTRQKTKNAVANISSSGEVCLEFLKTRRGEERVVDVMRISGDGARVVIYTPGASKSEGVPVGKVPPSIPSTGADAFHSYESLPQKYWKKYLYAARFVNLVKAKTPKITLYTKQAKCYLMENESRDFECHFYTGVRVTLVDQTVKLVEVEGVSHSFSHPVDSQQVPPSCSLHLHHFSSSLAHCCRLEEVLLSLHTEQAPVFPVIMGRRPQQGDTSPQKENRAPPDLQIKSSLLSKAGSATIAREVQHQVSRGEVHGVATSHRSLPSSAPTTSRYLRTVQIEGVGEALQLHNGNVRVNYLDSSCLVLRSNSSTVDFYPAGGGGWLEYDNSNLPEIVRTKVAGMPRVLELLMTGLPPVRPSSSVR